MGRTMDTVIMGAGPAGLAAGYELSRENIPVRIFEMDSQVGGISKTLKFDGFYFDLGGHRFFTKNFEVNKLWNDVLGEAFQKRARLSRIYFRNKYFNYPLSFGNAFFGLGVIDSFKIVSSYFKSKLFPYKPEETFEQWVSNRFGKKLFTYFFKTYTEKVWGIPCSLIEAEWASQRIKGLSLRVAIANAIFKSKTKDVKTLIDEFYYPVYGPGMMYNKMKEIIEKNGGIVYLNTKITKIHHEDFVIKSIEYTDAQGKNHYAYASDFISSIPITDLVKMLYPRADTEVEKAADNLTYRSFLTVNVIVNKENLFPDNWIYVHSPEVKLGRIQNFKNWSPNMVPDKSKTSLGLEYFCNEDDDFWCKSDEELFDIATSELEKLGICSGSDIIKYMVARVPKAYPVYRHGYRDDLEVIKKYLKQFKNLQLIGRYGLFKYNNMDHSILSGIMAGRNIINGSYVYDTWDVNSDDKYYEEVS